MVNSHGRFVWYELMTTDMETAKAFYAGVVTLPKIIRDAWALIAPRCVMLAPVGGWAQRGEPDGQLLLRFAARLRSVRSRAIVDKKMDKISPSKGKCTGKQACAVSWYSR
jgi:hypothetical protein